MMTSAIVPNVLPDSDGRRRALLEHDTTLLVEAGAGSGKTALLAGRIAMVLAAGTAPREIVAITFTEAAAAELLERIERYVGDLAHGDIPGELRLAVPDGLSDAQSTAVKQALLSLDELTCTTIHGFCQKLMKPYAVEAELDPGAQILDPGTAKTFHEELRAHWLADKLTIDAPDEMLVTCLRRLGPDALRLFSKIGDALIKAPRLAFTPPNGGLHSINALRQSITELVAWYAHVDIRMAKATEWIESLGQFSTYLSTLQTDPCSDDDLFVLLQYPRILACKKTKPNEFLKWDMKTAWGKEAQDRGLKKEAGTSISEAGAERYVRCAEAYQQFLYEVVDEARARILHEYRTYLDTYVESKRQRALLDFDDLLRHARNIVVHYPQLRAALQQRYKRIFVDEFQDTDPLQAEILWYLCGDGDDGFPWQQRRLRPGSLFLVGDPKQAIYGFRGADLQTYLVAKNALLAADAHAVLSISANFRSSEHILSFVNTVFEPLLHGDRGQPGFAPLVATRSTDVANTVPAVMVYDIVCEPQHLTAKGKLRAEAARQLEAAAVADTVGRMLGRHLVADRKSGKMRPCEPGDIALLAPNRTDMWIYERAFGELGIQIASQAGKRFYQRQEVSDLIALTRTIADPEDTLALGAFLRGPIVALTEEELADEIYAFQMHKDDTKATLRVDMDGDTLSSAYLREVFAALKAFSLKAKYATPYDVLMAAIGHFSVCSILRVRDKRAAERSLANVDQFLELARGYHAAGILEFSRVVTDRWRNDLAEVDAVADAGRNAVALVTMHHSKGLEWPVVLPVNCCSERRSHAEAIRQNAQDDTLHFALCGYDGAHADALKDANDARLDEEAIRLWYVTLTRARDTLVLPRFTHRIDNDWLSLLELDFDKIDALTIDEEIEPEFSTNEFEENQQNIETWLGEQQILAQNTRKFQVLSPSRHDDVMHAMQLPDLDDSISLDDWVDENTQGIQGGRERGILIHKLLEELLQGETLEDIGALEERAQDLVLQRAGVHGEIDVAEIAATVLRTMQIPQIAELRQHLHPEMPMYAQWQTERTLSILDGIADAVAFNNAGDIEVVIDWKSDVQPSDAPLTHYRRQLHSYMQAAKCKRGLLVFVSTGRVEEVTL